MKNGVMALLTMFWIIAIYFALGFALATIIPFFRYFRDRRKQSSCMRCGEAMFARNTYLCAQCLLAIHDDKVAEFRLEDDHHGALRAKPPTR